MQTIGLQETAKLLRCNAETVREKASNGEIPGIKVGRSWVFVEVDLLEWVRSQYNKSTQGEKCRSTRMKKVPIGSCISASTEEELEKALGLQTKKKLKKSTTNLKLVSGTKK
ncbi:helix-turn-helix domain-containing protein [Ferrovum myxofaciens]|uniref:helix-turn-helix domain-containing protein n=1 Tax=Ferrovum myxofaciens TaxID=416213 RepID=UPI003EB8B7A1|nr:helix-turn-helix domain-containing protein [Ferrovum myxofaciens]